MYINYLTDHFLYFTVITLPL